MQKVSLSALPQLAAEVLKKLAPKNTATVVALSGDLGAGKTTFVQALGKELDITETMQSPTYVLMKKYQIANNNYQTLVHIDAYRLNNAEEFAALKPEQFLQDLKALVVVEWPERVGNALPKADLTLNFSSENAAEGERFVEMQK